LLWGMSRIGSLLCFRDPTTLKAIGVIDLGHKSGVPLQLVDDTTAWERAANLTDYKRLEVKDLLLSQGGASLEYTYQDGPTKMHGENYMLRLNGHLFVVALLTSDNYWTVDLGWLMGAEASFALVK
jgi:hypothetical protein